MTTILVSEEKNICCGNASELPQRRSSNAGPQHHVFSSKTKTKKENEINYLRITTTHSPNMQPYYLNQDIKLARKSSFKLMKAGVTLNVTGSPHLFQLQLP